MARHTDAMIREAEADDAAAVATIYEPIVRDTFISFETEPPSHEEMMRRITESLVWLIFEKDNRVLGFAYATPFHARAAYRWSTELSVYVAPEAHRRGIAKKLLDELLDRLRASGFVNVFAGIALPNPASVTLFASFGFSQIALQKKVGFKLGAWRDVAWWQLQLRDPSIPPPQITGRNRTAYPPGRES